MSTWWARSRRPLRPRLPAVPALLSLLTVLIFEGGCATTAGDQAFRDGRYQQAADLFDAELKRAPGDRKLRDKLEVARLRSIDADLQRAEELRAANQGQAAAVVVGRSALHAQGWRLELPAETGRRMAAAVEATDHYIRGQVDQLIAEKSPLAARRLLDRNRKVLASKALRLTVAAADESIRFAGKARCAELTGEQSAQESPYWHWALGKYCAELGSPQPKASLPGRFKGMRVTIQTKDGPGAERHILEEWLADWFKGTVWYADDAGEVLAARVENDFDASLEKRPATLHASYRKRTTSTIVDETQMLSVPRQYSVETEEDFVYSATLYIATYHLDAVVTLELGNGMDPFVAHLKASDTKRAYDHDVNFPPANIHPQRPHLPSAADWLKSYLDHEVKPLSLRLGERWSRAYCGVTARTVEGASRCLFTGQPSPDAASAIQKKLGKDGPPALALFANAAPDPDATAADTDSDDEWAAPAGKSRKPAGPKIESVPAPRPDTI